jgi:hypothetical protein
MAATHVCHPIDYCTCSSQGLEPDEFCLKHGGCHRTWPPKCVECGHFIKQPKPKEPPHD